MCMFICVVFHFYPHITSIVNNECDLKYSALNKNTKIDHMMLTYQTIIFMVSSIDNLNSYYSLFVHDVLLRFFF